MDSLFFNKRVEKWDVFELELIASQSFDNPFTDIRLTAVFGKDSIVKQVKGFYDGSNTWRVRFMSEDTGVYSFRLDSDYSEFNGLGGSFESVEQSQGNHGPVKVDKKYHFSYADATPFFVMGTTAYAWTYRPEEVRIKTLASFEKNGFNKIRMLVFPKFLAGMDAIDLTHEPSVLPYVGERRNFDFKRFQVEYFRNFEERVRELLSLGIQADVILFHNYDFGMWGIDEGLSDDDAVFYLEYIIARLAAYRNVWWSVANEYDIYKNSEGGDCISKLDRRDWDRLGTFIMQNDPYQHPRSIHNMGPIYPNRDWLTHVSYQNPNTCSLMVDLKLRYGKPVIADEYIYEGNVPYFWGSYSGRKELLQHWLAVMNGGYATHGECYIVNGNKKDIFWTYGGELVGESAPRLKFMREVLETLPFQEMTPDFMGGDGTEKFCMRKDRDVILYFFNEDCKNRWLWCDDTYDLTIYDLWECKEMERYVAGPGELDLSSRRGMEAVKMKRLD